MPLCERLGGLAQGLGEGSIGRVEVEFRGRIAEHDTRLLGTSVLVGVLRGHTEEPVNLVNAAAMAEERGIELAETNDIASEDFTELVTVALAARDADAVEVAGHGRRPAQRPVPRLGLGRRLLPALDGHLAVFRYTDQPGMIGRVGTAFGEQGVNIVSAAVGAETGDDRPSWCSPPTPRSRRRPSTASSSSAASSRAARSPCRPPRGVRSHHARGGHHPPRGPRVLEVQERPDPPVGPGEVRVAVRAAGINFADLMARSGIYPDAPKPPCVIGYEVAGEVESVGEGVSGSHRSATGCSPGPASAATPSSSRSAPTRCCRCPSAQLRAGRGFVVNYTTAYAGLVMMGGLRAGDRMLIHAAAGGVGIAATQVAQGHRRRDLRHRVRRPSTTRSASRASTTRSTTTPDFEDEVMRITGGEGVDVVMDAIGPSSFARATARLRQGGRLVMFGLAEVQTGDRRDIPALLKGLARMPLATVPWWKSLAMMNENKGVFGLNMLKWWDREGLDRVLRAADATVSRRAARAGRRRGVPLRPRRRRSPVPRRGQERRQGRARPVDRASDVDATRVLGPRLVPAQLRLHPDERAHDPGPGERGGRGTSRCGGMHIHRLVWGILLCLICGYAGAG